MSCETPGRKRAEVTTRKTDWQGSFDDRQVMTSLRRPSNGLHGSFGSWLFWVSWSHTMVATTRQQGKPFYKSMPCALYFRTCIRERTRVELDCSEYVIGHTCLPMRFTILHHIAICLPES